MPYQCLFLDVFTDAPYAGNQLAVFPEAGGLNAARMQRLAQEINYSETTFILDKTEAAADFRVRIFTPRVEMPFAGHPVLGTAYAIMNILHKQSENISVLKLETKAGVIPLEKEGDNIFMTQPRPRFGKKYDDIGEIAELVNLRPEDISGELPVEEVATGIKVLIVPVRDLAAMAKASGQVAGLSRFFRDKDALLPYLFTLETTGAGAQVHTRCFGAHLGITEDPATGSAAGPLTAYLLKYHLFGDSFEISNEQGVEMGRPSRIIMRGETGSDGYSVRIGGACAYAGRGEFTID